LNCLFKAKEFLSNASKDKAFVFFVINRVDTIERKDRNKENILDQIKAISQSSFDNSEHLVHFISSKKAFQYLVLEDDSIDEQWIHDFEKLEDDLRNFILCKRVISKLAPAKVFLENLLKDLKFVLNEKIEEQKGLNFNIMEEVKASQISYQHLKRLKIDYFSDIDNHIDDLEEKVVISSKKILLDFISELELFMESVDYDGIFQILDYSRKLRTVAYRLASSRLSKCSESAKILINAELSKLKESTVGFIEDSYLVALEEFQSSPNSLLELSNQSYLDSSDQMDVLKEFFPSVFVGIISFAGYRAVTTLKPSANGRIGRLAFAGFALAGKILLSYFSMRHDLP
jgi:mitofusin